MDTSNASEADRDKILTDKESLKPSNTNLYLVAFVALNGWTMLGYTLAYTSPAVPDMEESGVLKTSDQTSWFSSLMPIGAIFAGPIAGYCLHSFGRKFTMMLCCLPLVVGYGLIASSGNIAVLYIGRILSGVGAGMISVSTPVYIAELSSPDLRGALVGGIQMFLGFGLLLVNTLGGISLSYVGLALVGCAIPTILVILLMFMPETPYYCIIKDDPVGALSVLTWLRGDSYDVNREYNDIVDHLQSNTADFRYREFLQPNLYKPLVISLIMMVLQQLSGIGAVTFYSVTIFQTSSPSIDDHVAAIIIAGVQVVGTLASVLLIDRVGRKVLLILAGIGMSISTGTFGLYYKLTEVTANGTAIDDVTDLTTAPSLSSSPDLTWLSLTSLIVFTSSFSLAWGSIPWLIMSEILPIRAKGPGSAISTIVNWSTAFVVTKEFFDMSNAMTNAGVFWFYSGVCLISVIFVALCVPETKGKSLEEISTTFQRQRWP